MPGYGHTAGDDCLRSVARVLQHSLLRSSDMATRYGGEEFGLLLPNTTLEGAFEVAERIRSAIERHNIPHDTNQSAAHVTLSDGIACLTPSSEVNPSELVALADEALYKAKSQGRNQSTSVNTMVNSNEK